MNGEEITLKVGLDASEFSTGTKAASEKLEAFAHHGAQEFGRLGGAGRVVTSVLREISATAPKVGEALTIAFGAVGVAGIAYKVLIERADDYLKKLDEIGKKNAEPIFGEEKVAKLREDLEAIDRRLKEAQKRQRLDPITGATEAILEETDPRAQGSSARQMLRRFAADKDAANKALVELTPKAKLLASEMAKVPEAAKLAGDKLQSALAAPESAELSTFKLFGIGLHRDEDIQANRKARQERDDNITSASVLLKSLKDKQSDLGTQLRRTNEEFGDQDRKVQALSKAIGELEKLLDKVDPGWTTRPLLQFQKEGSFRLSANIGGAPFGMTTIVDKSGAHLEKIAGAISPDGRMRCEIPNGP